MITTNKHTELAELISSMRTLANTHTALSTGSDLEERTADALRKAAALLEAQPAEQANRREAAAWRYKKAGGGWFVSDNEPQYVEQWNDIEEIQPLYTTPPAQPAREWVGLDEEKAEALIEDLAEWSRYVDADHAHQTLEKHVRDVLEKHGIKEKQ